MLPGQHEAIIDQAVWDAVQARLSAHRNARRHGADAGEPSLLAGILFDADGNRMTPSHTKRRGKRYRYYVSQALIQQPAGPERPPGRVGAYPLEAVVMGRLLRFLTTPSELLAILRAGEEDAATQRTLVKRAQALHAALEGGSTPQRREFLLATVWRIMFKEEAMTLEIHRGHLRAMVLGRKISTRRLKGYRPQPDQIERISEVVRIERRANGVKLVMSPQTDDATASGPSPALAKSIAIAHAAYEDLLNGEAKDMKSLARRYGVHPRHLRRIMPLAFLAPDLVSDVFDRAIDSARSAIDISHKVPTLWRTRTHDVRHQR